MVDELSSSWKVLRLCSQAVVVVVASVFDRTREYINITARRNDLCVTVCLLSPPRSMAALATSGDRCASFR